MPSKTLKQARAMRAADDDPAIARKLGIPREVAREYVAADERLSEAARKVNTPGSSPRDVRKMPRRARK